MIDRLLEMVQKIHPTAYFTNKSENDDAYRFSYEDKNEICFTSHVHKSNGFCTYINKKSGIVYMYCYSRKCTKLFKLGYLDRDNDWENTAIKIN